MSEKTLYQTIILPLRKSLNDTHALIPTKISIRIRAVKKRGQRGYKRENGALISFQIAVSFCAKGLSQQNTTKQRMHLKEVVNLHWTLRKGIKIGEKNMCLRTTDFSTRASSATTVRFSSVQWRTISREFVPRSNPLTFEEAKTSGGLESVHGGIKR